MRHSHRTGRNSWELALLAAAAPLVCRAPEQEWGLRACSEDLCSKGSQGYLEKQLCARKVIQPTFGEHEGLARRWGDKGTDLDLVPPIVKSIL